MAGILSRAKDILGSNINELLDKAEDPAKMADYYLVKYKKDLAEVKKNTQEVMANEAAAKRALENCQTAVNSYKKAAANAVANGDDAAARKLLEGMNRHKSSLEQNQKIYEAAKENADAMRETYNKLVSDIEILESRREAVKATQAQAKARESMNKMAASADRLYGADDAFSRMEDKANRRLDAAMAGETLDKMADTSEDLLKKYSGAEADVEAQLAALKAGQEI